MAALLSHPNLSQLKILNKVPLPPEIMEHFARILFKTIFMITRIFSYLLTMIKHLILTLITFPKYLEMDIAMNNYNLCGIDGIP